MYIAAKLDVKVQISNFSVLSRFTFDREAPLFSDFARHHSERQGYACGSGDGTVWCSTENFYASAR